jgi:hypothetical protein
MKLDMDPFLVSMINFEEKKGTNVHGSSQHNQGQECTDVR